LTLQKKIDDTNKVIAEIKDLSGAVRNTPSATDKLQSVLDTVDTISPIIGPLKTFNFIANGIADVLALICIHCELTLICRSIPMQRQY